MKKEYLQIGNREFELKPMVLGQVRQMKELLGIDFTKGTNSKELQSLAVEQLGTFVAIIVTEKGKSNAEKDVDELSKFVEDNLEVSKIQEVVNFFSSSFGNQLQNASTESNTSGKMELITRPRAKKKKK